LGKQYAKNNIPINVVQPKAPIEQVKQEQNYRQPDYNPNYDNQRRESQGWRDNRQERNQGWQNNQGYQQDCDGQSN
jgi:hypothetical protein